MSANASMNANRDYVQMARGILREAAEIEEREDELFGDARGDELPPALRAKAWPTGKGAPPAAKLAGKWERFGSRMVGPGVSVAAGNFLGGVASDVAGAARNAIGGDVGDAISDFFGG